MCLAKDYSEDLLIIFDNIIAEFNRLSYELSQADLREQKILHTIEKGKFNASEGYKLSKQIHDNRKRRREIKNELEPLGILKCNFIDTHKNILTKTYNSVTRKDNVLTHLTENQIYIPKVLDLDEEVKPSIIKSNFIPIPIPSTPKQQSQQIIEISQTYDIKTKQPIEIISKVDDETYYIKYKTKKGLKCLFKKNRIGNLNTETA
jgi:hypothetical protein